MKVLAQPPGWQTHSKAAVETPLEHTDIKCQLLLSGLAILA
jgi:hypothetical protein